MKSKTTKNTSQSAGAGPFFKKEDRGTEFDLYDREASSVIQTKKATDPARSAFPWIGRVDNTWNAALRRNPGKDEESPYGNVIADVARGTEVQVMNRKNGWLLVKLTLDGKETQGYISQELVTYVRASAFSLPAIDITTITPPLSEAFNILKRAQKKKAAEGTSFRSTEEEQGRIDAAIIAINETKKYVIDESTYEVNFLQKPGVKIEIDTIEDFILFVEQVEKQYPTASPREIVSEIRQLWFSDRNWELLVSSGGVSLAGKDVDIETEPNPVAAKFNMQTLAPATGGKQLDTRMGRVDIGHVMAGIDARISGFAAAYPKSELSKKGHDDDEAELKYKTFKAASGGDTRDFATWAGDIGQAYAEYLVDRYVKENTSSSFSTFIAAKASPAEILGDIHGYIAVKVYQDVPGSKSPTGREHKISNILRDMYLVEKSATKSYEQYFEEVSGKTAGDLKKFITDRSLAFASIWFAKKAIEARGVWKSKGFTKGGAVAYGIEEFRERHVQNEKFATPDNKLNTLIDSFLKQMPQKVK